MNRAKAIAHFHPSNFGNQTELLTGIESELLARVSLFDRRRHVAATLPRHGLTFLPERLGGYYRPVPLPIAPEVRAVTRRIRQPRALRRLAVEGSV
ncbi:hypothetical protein [Lacipirellula sp.]|uniref:hypothetical protein n=1 Tax=Lacipirellula sp. TaxID=2691419 RepID=UPI003D10EB17